MKSLSLAALLLLGSVSMAQTPEWYAARFGFNAPAADLFAHQSPSDYKNYAFNSGKPNARWNNTSAMMSGMGMVQAVSGMAWNDPSNHAWTDLYEMTDLLPKSTWVRVTGNLQNHFPNPYNPFGHVNSERNLQAILARIMFRGSDLSNGLNILWNLTPGVYPTEAVSDSWSTITTDANGAKLTTPLSMGDPARRDWWRPADEYLPYLRNNAQTFVYDVNNAAANIVRQRTGAGSMTENFIARMAFQLGNEPAAGHPGGSIDGAVGTWTGVGKVIDKTLNGLDYRPSPANIAMNNVPNFGTNPLTMPAFSMFSENVDSYRLNFTKGQLRNIQWGGNLAPAVNEIGTYAGEINPYTWQQKCNRRALHFSSPIYRWKFNPTQTYNSVKPNDLLTSQPQDPSAGRWETPAEYAKRWVDELEKQVNIVATLYMPAERVRIVDVTECYFGGAQGSGAVLDPGVKNADGSTVNFSTMTFDQVRTLSRSNLNVGGVLKPLQQQPASRESLLVAIRTELYNRDVAKTLTPNLGRIYWWGGYYSDPRTETGLSADNSNTVNGYNPWGDYRLTLSEVKALWGKS